MSSLSKFILAAVAVIGAAGASAHTAADGGRLQTRPVIASHEATPALSSVAQHVRHRHPHRRHRHGVGHAR